MDYLLLGRVAKLAALLGFVLPWVTVSCSGTEILTATGIQLMTGDPQPAGPLEGQQANTEDAEPAVAVILACVVIALGLAASFLPKARMAAAALLIGGLGGAGAAYYSVQNMQSEMTREINEAQSEAASDSGGLIDAAGMSQAVAGAIRVEEEEGYWLTLGGALIGALFGLLVLAGAAPVRKPDDAPSA